MEALEEKSVKSEKWFDNFVASLRADQVALEMGVADTHKSLMYDNLINGDGKHLIDATLEFGRMYYIQRMLVDFVEILGKNEPAPFNEIAVSFHNSGLLIWAEIPNGREDLEDKLILAEAKVNAKYHVHGFDMDTTFVEECDNLPIPSHYQSLFRAKTN